MYYFKYKKEIGRWVHERGIVVEGRRVFHDNDDPAIHYEWRQDRVEYLLSNVKPVFEDVCLVHLNSENFILKSGHYFKEGNAFKDLRTGKFISSTGYKIEEVAEQ